MSQTRLFMPVEWAKHARTLLAWPSLGNRTFLGQSSLKRATDEVSSLAEAISKFEPVTLLVGRERLPEAHRRFHRPESHITIHPVEGDELDVWMRDIAPTCVVETETTPRSIGSPSQKNRLHGIDFRFNGWGNRYPSPTTSSLARTLLSTTRISRTSSSIVTEGGALEVDGDGTLLATESSVLNSNRNSGLDRAAIETELKRCLGVSKVVWIPGIKGADSTDCHIDALARFVRPGGVVLSKPSAVREGLWMRVYEEARRVLERERDAKGRGFELYDIVEPDVGVESPGGAGEGEAPVMSYVNYYLADGAVVVPRFGDEKADADATDMLGKLFPNREVAHVFIRELPLAGGGIHCATQQVPLVEE